MGFWDFPSCSKLGVLDAKKLHIIRDATADPETKIDVIEGRLVLYGPEEALLVERVPFSVRWVLLVFYGFIGTILQQVHK